MSRVNTRKILLLCLAGVCALSVSRFTHASFTPVSLTIDSQTSIFDNGVLEAGILFELSGSFFGNWEENDSVAYDDTISGMNGTLTATVANAGAVDTLYGTTSSVGDTWGLIITNGQFSQTNNNYAGGALSYQLFDDSGAQRDGGIFSFAPAAFSFGGPCNPGSGSCTPNNFDYDPVAETGLFAMVDPFDNSELGVSIGGNIALKLATTPIPSSVVLFVSALFALFGIGRRLQTPQETS